MVWFFVEIIIPPPGRCGAFYLVSSVISTGQAWDLGGFEEVN
jgi:hypothetical protein